MTTAKSSWNDLNSSQVPFGSIMDVAGRKTRRCDHGGALATWTAVRVAASQQTVTRRRRRPSDEKSVQLALLRLVHRQE